MIKLFQLPVLKDNYIYILVNTDIKKAIIVDPSQSQDVFSFISTHLKDIHVEAIFNTHHHFDHVGGNDDIVKKYQCRVFGPKKEHKLIPNISNPLSPGECISCIGLSFKVLDVHAHTSGHIAYQLQSRVDKIYCYGHQSNTYKDCHDLNNHQLIFVGDSLFAGGCGRLFEGSVEDLVKAMQCLANQDGNSLIACAHEYTYNNLLFADSILPSHKPISQRFNDLQQYKNNHASSSVPSFLRDELITNPFLLILNEKYRNKIAKKLNLASKDIITVMGSLRKAKDIF